MELHIALDRHLGLRARGHRPQATRDRARSLHFATDPERPPFRESPSRTSTCGTGLHSRRYPRSQPVAGLRLLTGPDGSRMIPVRYTHNQLASMVGSNREALTRAFARLRKAGAVEVRNRHITSRMRTSWSGASPKQSGEPIGAAQHRDSAAKLAAHGLDRPQF
jgi:hypothetical protein